MRKKRKRKTRTGSDAGGFAAAALAALLVMLPAYGAPVQKSQTPTALIVGTVFRDSGLSLPGAEVTLRALGDSEAARKFKKMQFRANQRGEFAFRVPADPLTYVLSVKAPGYQPQEKTVEIPAQDGADVFFRLDPASKQNE